MAAPWVWILLLLIQFASGLGAIETDFRRDIFSTKTAYAWVYNTAKDVDQNEWMKTKYGHKHCVAVNSQVFLRHGARYPGYKDIRKMTALHEKLKLTVKSQDYNFLKEWENDFPESEEKQLVDEGEDEQFGLGQRYGKRLWQLFDETLDNVKFISSSKDRCTESAHNFYEGLTEVILHEAHDDLKPDINDDVLRFHTKCHKFIEAVENNRTHMLIYKRFKDSPKMKEVAKNVKRRLGIEHAEITAGELKLIYFWCTFEMIILQEDHWCHILTDEEYKVMEYHNDMKQYWKKAYGHPVIAEMACPLMQMMFSSLDKVISGWMNNQNHRGNVATFFFGHTETLAPLFAAFGFFKDSYPLLHTNYEDMKSRAFRSSQILPFSANLAMILYKCDYADVPVIKEEDFVIRFYVNEKPLLIPQCGDFVCTYKQVREVYAKHIDQCVFDHICRLEAHDEL